LFFFFSSRRRHTRFSRDWSSDVCSSDLLQLDFFKERRSGIFLERGSVPSYVGLQTQPTGNLGIIDNKGFDASLTWNKKFNDFFVQLRGNVTWNRNKIIEDDQPEQLYPWLDKRGMKVGRRLGLIAL